MMRHVSVTVWVAALVFSAGTVACGDDGESDSDGGDAGLERDGGRVSTRTLTDDGEVCLMNASSNNEGTEALDPGSIVAEVTFDACLSSTCDTVQATECEATVREDSIVVESSATIRQSGRKCSGDCGSVRVACDVGELEAGEYALEHGDESLMFSVPSNQVVCGAGTSPFAGAL